MKTYKPVIGLEIHVELKTDSKMFCRCVADHFGKEPNSQVCPVCLGLPGALPVPNKKAIEYTMKLSKALNCKINTLFKFDRKNYFYPDLPKGYQISQYDEPIGYEGFIELKDEKGESKKIRITRVHQEEDTGKLIHEKDETLIDFNRSGVPLTEIVTEPDFETSDDVKRFLEELQVIIRYLEISDVEMEKGSMRLEPSISIRVLDKEDEPFKLPDYKVEVKNINSFNFAKAAIDYEIKRQKEVIESGKQPVQETRGYNENQKITVSQRKKETASDYRYFPEPDIPPFEFTKDEIAEITKDTPQLPEQRLLNLIANYEIKYKDAYILTRKRDLVDFYERVLEILINEEKGKNKKELAQKIANLIINKKISTDISEKEFINKFKSQNEKKSVDVGLMDKVINEVIEENPSVVEQYKNGKESVIMFFVGQCMKKLKGQADANELKKKIKEELG